MEDDDIKSPVQIDIYYDRTPSYRVYHVDGAHGGWTGKAYLAFDFYVEQSPSPQVIRHNVDDKGQLGDIVARGGREGIVRQSECGVIMDFMAAVQFHAWLGERIEHAQRVGLVKIEKGEGNEVT